MTHHLRDKALGKTLKNLQDKSLAPLLFGGQEDFALFSSACMVLHQMRTLEVKKAIFDEFDVVACRISAHSIPSRKAWAKHNTELLSDFWPDEKLLKKYGLFLIKRRAFQKEPTF